MDKIGKNEKCPCGKLHPITGLVLKFKKCCGSTDAATWERSWKRQEVERFVEWQQANPGVYPGEAILQYAKDINYPIHDPKAERAAKEALGIIAAVSVMGI
jgi:hypothetical protein